jgi:hypothetical protein
MDTIMMLLDFKFRIKLKIKKEKLKRKNANQALISVRLSRGFLPRLRRLQKILLSSQPLKMSSSVSQNEDHLRRRLSLAYPHPRPRN